MVSKTGLFSAPSNSLKDAQSIVSRPGYILHTGLNKNNCSFFNLCDRRFWKSAATLPITIFSFFNGLPVRLSKSCASPQIRSATAFGNLDPSSLKRGLFLALMKKSGPDYIYVGQRPKIFIITFISRLSYSIVSHHVKIH